MLHLRGISLSVSHRPIAQAFAARCLTAWDGDDFGNEWKIGYIVHETGSPLLDAIGWNIEEDTAPFEVYSDDGLGNGDYVDGAGTMPEAAALAIYHALAQEYR